MPLAPVVTISAAYGAGGSRVAPLLAEHLGVSFAGRVMHRGLADRIAGNIGDASRGEHSPGRSLGRLLRQFSAESDSDSTAVVLEQADAIADAAYRDANEEAIRAHLDDGCVILGRAAAVVLRDLPHALHVRMSGPRDLRIAQAMVVEEIDEPTARWRQATEDLARDTFVRHFYDVDPTDDRLYHLTIDSTRLPLAACVSGIAAAALALVAHD